MQADLDPSLTIVIPTRERCDTLYHALHSCVTQDCPNLTILVVDNFSQDQTATVVRSFADPRIRYLNTGRRLSMSANWEFSLRQVDTDYVMFLGDDDAVLPHGAATLLSLAAAHPGVDCITWPSVEYGWPSCSNEMLRNTLVISTRKGTETRHARETLRDVIEFRRPYAELPFLYKGFVKTAVIDRLRDDSGGVVFHSMIPDVYFGIASCAVIDRYLYSFAPFTLNGASSHSNGTAAFSTGEGKTSETLFLSEDNIPFHSTLVFCASVPVLVTESLLQAKKCLQALDEFAVDYDAMTMAALAQSKRSEDGVFTAVLGALRTIATRVSLKPETVRSLQVARNRPFYPAKRIYGNDPFNRRIVVDCRSEHVSDCFAASNLAQSLLSQVSCSGGSAASSIPNGLRLLKREFSKRTGLFS